MAGRSPARFLAPIALDRLRLRAVFRRQGRPRARGRQARAARPTPRPTPTAKPAPKKKSTSKKKRKTYTVKSGDTPSGIAEKTGVSLETLNELNPELDPQTLAPGQKIRLSE